MKELFDKVPGNGSRTIISVVLFVLVELGKIFGVGVDQVDPSIVNAVELILGGLVFIFAKIGLSKSVK